jgi:hypothetical protein
MARSFVLSKEAFQIFSKSIHSLMKFNDSIFIHVSHKFCVSAISPSNSTFALFEFDQRFFVSAEFGDQFEAKILAKPLANLLKLNVDTVVEAKISIQDDRICFDIECKNGIEKRHLMQYEETPNVRAVYDVESPNKAIFNPQVFLDVFMNFPSQLGHVSLFFEPDSFKLKTVFEKGPNVETERSLDTLVTVDLEDFETFIINDPVAVTLDAKELKVPFSNQKILVFGDQLSVSVQLSFSQPGSPCILRYIVNSNVIADFVISTFQVEESQAPLQTQKASTPAVFRESVFSNRKNTESRKIQEPLPKEEPRQTEKTLFQEFNIFSQQVQDNENEEDDFVLPTQFQKKPKFE